ncbi:ABC transporter substrate-binding protein [Mesorhizobium opportunistum]|uniref:ABC transporter substrate-binding protein n=1 Tax=Mesorhizobium opportunistum TaxID=593909 RepID=UPI00333B9D6A
MPEAHSVAGCLSIHDGCATLQVKKRGMKMTGRNHLGSQAITRRGLLFKTAAYGLCASVAPALLSSIAMADAPRRGGKLVIGVKGGSSSDTLDPAHIISSVTADVSYQYGNLLIDRSPGGKLQAGLAESWETPDGGKHWVVRLKQGVKFHNGKEFTSADMVYSLNRHRDPANASGALPLMGTIDDIKADGPHQLTISLKGADVGFPYLLAYIHLVAQPEEENPDNADGTGPFVLDIAEPGKRYAFHRNPDYFKPDSVWFDELEMLVINDDTARLSALLSGSAHIITEVSPSMVARLDSAPNLNISRFADSKFYYFAMLVDTPPFDNADLRLALKYAVDREAIVKSIYAGYGEVGADVNINSFYPLFSDDIPKHSYDVEKAKHHYEKSGHSGPIVLQVSDVFPGAVDMAAMFQQSAGKAGITIELHREPADGYWDNVWRKAPFCISYWGSLISEDQALSLCYGSSSNINDTHWSRPDFDKLLVEARAELDPQKRKSLYRDAAMMVNDDGGHIVVMFPEIINGVSKKVKGYVDGDQRNTEHCWFET